MATEQDTSNTEAVPRPQTPAARRRNPAAAHRTAADRERLREESRARRQARSDGEVVAPEPQADEITVRRMPPTPPSPAAPPRPSTPPAGPLRPSTPAGEAAREKAASQAPAPEAAEAPEEETAQKPREEVPLRETAPAEPLRETAPADAPAPAPQPLRELARNALQESGPLRALREGTALQGLREGVALKGLRDGRALAALRESAPVRALRDSTVLTGLREAVKPASPPDAPYADAPPEGATPAAPLYPPGPPHAPAPPSQPQRSDPDEPPAERGPRSRRERAAALLGLASAVGVAVCLAASIGSGSLPGLGGGMRAEASSRVVAPGGWLTLSGEDAPRGESVVLESRSGDGPWHSFARADADSDGDFDVRGRVLQRPGRIEVRARVPGTATAAPIAVTVRPLRLAAVGDINLGDAPGDAIAAHGPAYPWRDTGKALKAADLAFGNLESAVSTRGEPFPKQYNFRGTPAALAGLRRNSGIDVLNLANNHVGDYGPAATIDTVRGVERLGMKAVGAGPNLRRALAPQVVERLGLKVAFVGFSEIAPIEFAAAKGRPGTAWAKPGQIAAAVHAARRKADIVVATFHWGIEKQTLESARQRQLADVAVRSGAQVVIGAHPHTLQPVRRQGGAIVAYSLGNFVFGAQSPETSSTGILELQLTAEGVSRANWKAAHISGVRPQLFDQAPKRLPLRDNLAMQAGVNLPEL